MPSCETLLQEDEKRPPTRAAKEKHRQSESNLSILTESGLSWSRFAAILDHLCPTFPISQAFLGAFLAQLGAILASSRGYLEAFQGLLGSKNVLKPSIQICLCCGFAVLGDFGFHSGAQHLQSVY